MPPRSETPEWLTAVHEADVAADYLRDQAEQNADLRAHAIWRGVQEAGRNGRPAVADLLGVRVGAVDKAIARAKGNPLHSHLPGNLLERLLDLELAEVPPLTTPQWQAIAHLVRATVVDVTWLHDPAGLLADEIQDAGRAGDLDGIDTEALAAAVRTWRRTQTVAVLEAIRQDATDSLPTTDRP
ncbi:hypothetical protein AB0442_29525 [Kitasatospora sp. NPDC085895]|uniref:hypothetical protein n=1 Tax=Kitasatospora sp. NPDC085895 TaxID=3155057 RepID=UPI003450198D